VSRIGKVTPAHWQKRPEHRVTTEEQQPKANEHDGADMKN